MSKQKHNNISAQKAMIINELERLRNQMIKQEQLFNLADSSELIDAAIFEQRAIEARYAMLLKQAKENGIAISCTDRSERNVKI